MGQAYVGITLKGVPLQCGLLSYSDPTDNGNGTLTLPTLKGNFDSDAAGVYAGNIVTKTIPAGTTGAGGIPAIPDNSVSYICADYNGGAPVWTVITDTNLIGPRMLSYATIYREGTYLNWIGWDSMGLGLAEKISERHIRTERFSYESGLVVTANGAKNVFCTSGYIWTGPVRKQIASFDSTVNAIKWWYHVAGVWTNSDSAIYINDQYDNGTNVVALDNNKWTVNWVYRSAGYTGRCVITLGGQYASYAEAVAALEPTKPPATSALGVLTARIVVQKGSTSPTILSAFSTPIGATSTSDHESLGGLLGGSASNHYHFAQYADVTAAQAALGSDGTIAYVKSLRGWFQYVANPGTTIATDSFSVLTTGDGGVTRWLRLERESASTGGITGWSDNAVQDNQYLSLTKLSTTKVRLTVSNNTFFMLKGVRVGVPAGNYDITLIGTQGERWIGFDDATLTLKQQSSLPDFRSFVLVAAAGWTGTVITFCQTEFHGMRDLRWHRWAHRYLGLQYESGLTFTGNVQADNNTDPGVDTVEYLWSTTGVVADEDAVITPGGGTWLQTLGSGLTSATAMVVPIFYWDGSNVVRVAPDANRYPFLYTGANGAPEWNNGGTRTAGTSGQYVVYHYFASPGVDGDAIFGRPHNAVFASLVLAQAAVPSSLIWTNFPVAEVKHIYSAIFRVGSWAPSPVHNSKLVALTDRRLNAGSPSAAIAGTDHQILANRTATNAHPDTAIATTPTFVGALDLATESTVALALARLSEFGFLGDWATGKTYRVGNQVRNAGTTYRASTAHTAAAAFATDRANWYATTPSLEAAQTPAAGGTITAIDLGQWQTIPVSGSGGVSVTLSAAPFGAVAPVRDGERITLLGMSNIATVIVPHSDTAKGCLLSGDCELSYGKVLTVMWNDTLNRWVELSRNNVIS